MKSQKITSVMSCIALMALASACAAHVDGSVQGNGNNNNGSSGSSGAGGGVTIGGSTSGSTGSSGSSNNGGYSFGGGTKDSSLQRSQVAQQDLDSRAQSVATQFSMNFDSARQLTQLADTMAQLSNAGKFTGEDQLAISQQALTVAGISQTEYQAAMGNYVNGNKTAFDALINKGAQNLGMPSSAALRDQILPSLGINVNHL